MAALLHGTLVVGVSQTLRRWTEGATYIRQGDHHVGHWPTFLAVKVLGLTHSLSWKIWELNWDLTWNIWMLRKNGHLRFDICLNDRPTYFSGKIWDLILGLSITGKEDYGIWVKLPARPSSDQGQEIRGKRESAAELPEDDTALLIRRQPMLHRQFCTTSCTVQNTGR